MGKIRVKTIGVNELELEQKQKVRKRKEAKKVFKEEAVAKPVKKTSLENTQDVAKEENKSEEKFRKQKKAKFANKKVPSKSYTSALKLVDRDKKYTLSEAVTLLKKLKRTTFDETVELHINTFETGVCGDFTLPHGTGKQMRVEIASDEVIDKVEKGKVDFDVLLAEPSMMPKLAKVARILGPKGLMPNPRNATITSKPEETAKKYKDGYVSFKTEAKFPIIHLTVGKVSFAEKFLSENIKTVLSSIDAQKIKNITLKSTMSPRIKIVF